MAWQPAWQLLVAFNNAAMDDPTTITTVASPPGTLGGHNVWTDVTADVRDNVDTNRGKQHELDHVQAGTLTFTLDNRSGNYDPWATSGPYAGLCLPGKPVRLQATTGGTTYPLFTGITDVWASQWTGEFYATAAVSCVDLFGYMQNMYINNPAYYTNMVQTDGATHLYRLADPPTGSSIADAIGGTTGPAYNTRAAATGPLVTDMLPAVNLAPSGTPTGLAQTATLPSAGNWAVEIWANHTSAPAATSYLWSDGYNNINGSPPGVAIWVDTSGRPGFTDPTGNNHNGTASIADGNWHHLVLNYLDSTVTYTLYVDAASVTSAAATALGAPSGLGLLGMPSWATPGCYGSVANLAIYPGVTLTPTQITNHYQTANIPAELSGNRVARVARTLMGVPLALSSDLGNSTIQPLTGQSQGQQLLSYLQNVEQSEAGLMYITAAGGLTWKSRGTVYGTTTPSVTFTDAAGGIPFELAPQLATDTQDVYSQVQLQRNGGANQTAGAVNGPFGARTIQNSGLLNNTDAEVAGMATWLLNQFATPKPRLRQIVVRPVSTAATGTAMTALLGLEIGAVVTVTRTGARRGTFTTTANVDGINLHVYPQTGDWNAELQLTPLAPQRPWTLGASTLGNDTNLFF